MADPLVQDSGHWTHPTDYFAFLSLAGAAREAGADLIRFRSVRDPGAGANTSLS